MSVIWKCLSLSICMAVALLLLLTMLFLLLFSPNASATYIEPEGLRTARAVRIVVGGSIDKPSTLMGKDAARAHVDSHFITWHPGGNRDQK